MVRQLQTPSCSHLVGVTGLFCRSSGRLWRGRGVAGGCDGAGRAAAERAGGAGDSPAPHALCGRTGRLLCPRLALRGTRHYSGPIIKAEILLAALVLHLRRMAPSMRGRLLCPRVASRGATQCSGQARPAPATQRVLCQWLSLLQDNICIAGGDSSASCQHVLESMAHSIRRRSGGLSPAVWFIKRLVFCAAVRSSAAARRLVILSCAVSAVDLVARPRKSESQMLKASQERASLLVVLCAAVSGGAAAGRPDAENKQIPVTLIKLRLQSN